MQAFRITVVLLVAFLLFDGAVTESFNCSCKNGTTDCSFRRKTVIQGRELCSGSSKWNFRGNYLRKLPKSVTFEGKVDISMNEFGLSKRFSINMNSVKELDVSNNYLFDLKFLHPIYRCDLIVLNVSNNAITKLGKDHQCCRNIFVLRIANNKLTQLTNDSFSHQELLRFLDLSGNPLKSISLDTFSRLTMLGTLDISNTHLSEIPEGIFWALSQLQHLHLSSNNFTKFPMGVFDTLGSLVSLYLQRNAIRELQPGIFDTLYQLKLLDLDNNLLEHLPAQLFRRLHSLEHLSARGNRLRELPSLHLCGGPLRTALFAENAISDADQDAVRALWRPGFQLADLTHNPIGADTLDWARSATDVNVFTEASLYKINMVVMDRGVVWVQNE